MKRTVPGRVAIALLAVGVPAWPAAAANLADLPANTWTCIYDAAPGIIAHHARFLYLPGQRAGLLWPNYNWTSRHVTLPQHAELHLYDPAAARWTTRPSSFPKGARVEPRMIGQSCVVLGGSGKVLVALPSGRGSKVRAASWLLDPAAGTWSAVGGGLRMSDRSGDYNCAPGRDGSPVPLYGALCYDAHNRAAVLICGGGTWGRVGKAAEPVAAGDWIYDQRARRIRRLTGRQADKPAKARKWYPANCGTWLFSEASRTWQPLAQPLGEQPSGRILPGAAYDAGQRRVVLFGGDDHTRCLRDTWVFDCRARTWRRADPETAPPARAGCAMVYVPDQKVVLLTGGYGPGWVKLSDTWVYRTDENTWTKLAADLPAATQYCSAAYEPAGRSVLACASNPSWGRHKKTTLYALRLDVATAATAPAPPAVEATLHYHCKHGRWSAPLPAEWLGEANKPPAREAGLKALAELPANTWVHRKPPMKARARVWGIYVYDPRGHKGYAWGGGHFGYIGGDVCEYDLVTNRWRGMADAVNYKHLWRHPAGGGSPGVSFQGWALMGTHARKSYAVDPLSDAVITLHGDVYSIPDRTFVACIGRCPGRYGLGDQVAFVSAPHGLYAYHSRDGGALHRANVAAGRWDRIAKGGPAKHHERNHLCYDAKRDRLVYIRHDSAEVWTFDFAAKAWRQDAPAGPRPPRALGDSAYVGELDAAVLVQARTKARDATEEMFFYKLGERRWYSAACAGDRAPRANDGLSHSIAYDPKLKVLVRFTHRTREEWVETFVLRLEPAALKLTPLE